VLYISAWLAACSGVTSVNAGCTTLYTVSPSMSEDKKQK